MASALWKRKAKLRAWLDIAETVCITVVLSILFLTLLFRTGYVHGSSMEPTAYEGDRYIISDLFYTPKQGDIVIFSPDIEGEEKLYVKRVIATEGQRVQIKKDSSETYQVYVDEQKLDESYLASGQITYPPSGQEEFEVTVPAGQIFTMGDNRLRSNDSRAIGCVDVRRIVGHALFRFYPLNKIGTVK